MVNWDSPLWGIEGHNVHESETGSWIPGAHGEDQ